MGESPESAALAAQESRTTGAVQSPPPPVMAFPTTLRVAVVAYALIVVASATTCADLVGRYEGHSVRIREWMAQFAVALLAGHAALLLIQAWAARGARVAAALLGLAAVVCLVQARLTVEFAEQSLVARGAEVITLTMLGGAPWLLRSAAWLLLAWRVGRWRPWAVGAAVADLAVVAGAVVAADQAVMPLLHPGQAWPLGLAPLMVSAVVLVAAGQGQRRGQPV
jgi:hypothetical protein